MNKAVRKLSIGLSLMVLLSLFAATTPALAGTPDPEVAFSATPTSGHAPLSVQFTDETVVEVWATAFLPLDDLLSRIGVREEVPECGWRLKEWDFGDGGTSTAAHPIHVYTEPGQYTVSLTYEWCGSTPASFLPLGDILSNGTPEEIVPAPVTETKELYITVLAPREEWDKPLEPAKMSVSYLDIAPTQVHLNQVVRISGNVCNQGEEDGTKTVTLMVNGHAEQSQTVGVSGGSCKLVVFSVSKALPGTYQVSVDGMQGQFSVLGPPRIVLADTAPPQQDTGLGTAGILAIVVVGIVLIIALVLILKKE